MVHFSKLKLYGFKSFVDKTELDIGPGLNGIVGPNGCGKSNLVEALRWVMGEKSAKNMRGGGMEDVIFAGTAKRPARNAAEVAIIIDNQDGQAPAPFQHTTEIEITRRIEKDKGSQYRVNGKSVRARDVNLLFADTMTGANSPALVSQGRITEIIMAKPQDRRRILEESAGISGLHSRRHEAELRLRAAEQNLLRLDDVLREMRGRLSSLKRQSRQAERYKELSATIRQYDMALAWMGWVDTRQKIKAGREEFATHNATVQTLLQTTQQLVKDIEAQEKDLPDLRKKDTELRAVLQNFRVSLERLEQNIQTKLKNLAEAQQAKAQLDKDNDFAKTQYDDVINAIEATQTSLESARQEITDLPQTIQALEELHNKLRNDYLAIQTERQNLQTEIAVAEESRDQIVTRLRECRTRLGNVNTGIERNQDFLSQLKSKITDIESDPVYKADLDALRQAMDKAQSEIESLEQSVAETNANLTTLKDTRNELHTELRGIESEKTALTALVENTSSDAGNGTLLKTLKVETGYEKAVSTALDHWLTEAGTDSTAAVYWAGDNNGNTLSPVAGCTKMADIMEAPAFMQTVISGIGIVDTTEQGHDLAAKLVAGQMIVSKTGDIWRWDGLRVNGATYQAQDTAALILEQSNRIKALEKSAAETSAKLAEVEDKLNAAREELDAQQTALNAASDAARMAKNSYFDTERTQTRLQDQMQSLLREEEGLNARMAQLAEEQAELVAQEKSLEEGLSKTDSDAINRQKAKIASFDEQLSALQRDIDAKHGELAAARNKNALLTSRIDSLGQDLVKMEKEKQRLFERLEDLTNRQDVIDRKISDYQAAQNQDNEDSERESLLSKIASQDEAVRDNGIKLELAEKTYRDNQNALREAEANAATAREKRAVIQTNVANFEEELAKIQENIAEQFAINPQHLEEQVLSLFEENVPERPQLQAERDKAIQQRDAIGPVNLRAAIESDETETQLAELEAEHNDLVKAIEQLRTGINKLNREARERLAIAFKRVDQYFQVLFADLFGGGKAYLEMIESDDPLESGLEIYAQPPGKSLQTLSLLSGGEQTLTATALIFAMFQTNPSPICVLDEIDAPLDDANVDRVCSLMEKIARETNTRFIVITHHRMTMARMDRLYGVTMGELGVSQLVSVDLGAIQEELQLSETA